MRAIFVIAYRNLIKNRTWSIPTGIAILIAVALLSGLGTITSTYFKSSQSALVESQGPSHVVAFNAKQDQVKALLEMDEIKGMEILPVVSYAKITDYRILSTQSPYLKLMAIDQVPFEEHSFRLVSGTYPMRENEIALNESLLFFTDLDLKVGDRLKIDHGIRKVDDQETTSRFYNIEFEEFDVSGSKEYTVTGFLTTNNNAIGDFEDAGFISVVNSDTYKDNQNIILIELENANYQSYQNVTNFLNENKIGFNKTVLMSTFFTGLETFSESPLYFLTFSSFLLGALILLASMLVIRNSYSINQRYLVKQLGLLDAIGATQTQKLMLLILQSLLFSLICIPLGLMIGYMGASIILMYFRGALSEMVFYSNVVIHFYPEVIFFIVVTSFTVIVFTSIYPAIKVSSLSSIESIKFYNREIEKYGHVVAPSLFKKIESRLAYTNYRRGRVYYRSLTLSLILSIVLIGASVSFVNVNQKSQLYSRKDIVYLYEAGAIEDGKLNDIVLQLKEAPVSNQAGLWTTYTLIIDEASPIKNKQLNEFIETQLKFLKVNVVDDDYCVSVLQKEFAGFDCANQGLFVDYLKTSYLVSENKIRDFEGKVFDEDVDVIHIDIEDFAFDLSFDEVNYFYASNINEEEPSIYFSRETFNQLSTPFVNFIKESKVPSITSIHQIFVNGDNNADAFNLMRSTLTQNGIEDFQNITNIKNLNFLIVQFTRFIGLLGFSLVALVIVIALSNVINSVNHSLNVRLKETSILLASGMTVGSFIKMVLYENLMFGFVAMVIGIPVAMGISTLTTIWLGLQVPTLVRQWLMMFVISTLLVVMMVVIAILMNVITIRHHDINQLTSE